MNAQLKPMVCAGRTYDVDLIKSIMSEAADDIQEDGFNLDDWTPDLLNTGWILICQGGDVMGVFQLKKVGAVSVDIHMNILKQHRRKRQSAGMALWSWVSGEPWIKKITAGIPVTYPQVIKYAKDIGFTREGINAKSYLKHGQIIDKELYGITRREIENYARFI